MYPQYEKIRERRGFTVQTTGVKQTLPDLSKRKGERSDEMLKATVIINGVIYDADEVSMDRANRLVSIANQKYNKAVASGIEPSSAYDAVYKTTVPWVGADNVSHQVQIESLAEMIEKAMENMGMVWSKYAK